GKAGCFGIGTAPWRVAQVYQITPKEAGFSDVPKACAPVTTKNLMKIKHLPWGKILGATVATWISIVVAIALGLRSNEPIEVVVKGAPPVSSDPIERLTNRGYTFDRSGFIRAAENGDTRSVALFCETAGERWLDYSFVSMMKIDESVTDAIALCNKEYSIVACSLPAPGDLWSDYATFAIHIRSNERNGNLSKICGAPFVAELERRADAAK
ncbi:hypothetical protein, partial [Primorskyibacter flagellatus]